MISVEAAGGLPAAGSQQRLSLRAVGPERPQGLAYQFPDNNIFGDRLHRGDRLAVRQAGLFFLTAPVVGQGDEQQAGCDCVWASRLRQHIGRPLGAAGQQVSRP